MELCRQIFICLLATGLGVVSLSCSGAEEDEPEIELVQEDDYVARVLLASGGVNHNGVRTARDDTIEFPSKITTTSYGLGIFTFARDSITQIGTKSSIKITKGVGQRPTTEVYTLFTFDLEAGILWMYLPTNLDAEITTALVKIAAEGATVFTKSLETDQGTAYVYVCICSGRAHLEMLDDVGRSETIFSSPGEHNAFIFRKKGRDAPIAKTVSKRRYHSNRAEQEMLKHMQEAKPLAELPQEAP